MTETPHTAGSPRPGRLDIGVVGAGRVGAVLGAAWRAAGHRIVGASAVSTASHDRIDALLPGVPVRQVPEIVAQADLVLIAVPDDALAGLVSGLAATGAWRPGQLVVHTCGSRGLDVLEPAQRAGAIAIALHPAMTFTGTSMDLARLTGCPVAVTAPATVLPIGQALVVELGGEPVALSEGQRGRYHAALAHGANHLVTLVAQARDLLGAAGIEEADYLRPLLAAALDGALRGGDLALTGPLMRGDAGTVARHLGLLDDHDAGSGSPPIAPTYRALAHATLERLVAADRLRPEVAAELRLLLADPPPIEELLPVPAADPAAVPEDRPAPMPGARGPDGGSTPGGSGPRVARTRAELDVELARTTGRRAVVMTMGALHEGHLDLVRAARRHADHVVVTIFVNPLQFGAGEDFDRYPRTLESDVAALAEVGADLVFAPEPDEVYPDGQPGVRVDAGPLGSVLEGASRPGHFEGVLTVVTKLLGLTRADVAAFGEKDYQQLALVRALVRDLDLSVEILGVPIRREPDGLAMSSRNRYLDDDERARAQTLSRALEAGARAAGAGLGAEDVRAAALAVLTDADVELDYLVLADAESLEALDAGAAGEAVLLVAARVGATRLIDNRRMRLSGGS